MARARQRAALPPRLRRQGQRLRQHPARGNAVAANVACYLGYMCRIALGDLTSTHGGYEWLELAA